MDEELRALLRSVIEGKISDLQRVRAILRDAEKANLDDWILFTKARDCFFQPADNDEGG